MYVDDNIVFSYHSILHRNIRGQKKIGGTKSIGTLHVGGLLSLCDSPLSKIT